MLYPMASEMVNERLVWFPPLSVSGYLGIFIITETPYTIRGWWN
jgi:hypothetical protein